MADEYQSLDTGETKGEGDTISIKDLQLPHGVHAPDVWGRSKEQPALISVSVFLRDGLNSAASKDQLDQSTVHYGELAKRIRAGCTSDQTVDDLTGLVKSVVRDMSMRVDRSCRTRFAIIVTSLPKASMSGDGISVTDFVDYASNGETTRHERYIDIQNVKIMTLIGVNDIERTQKQPLVANLTLLLPSAGSSQQLITLFGMESKLVEVIQDTSFETLESLAEHTVNHLRDELAKNQISCTHVKLQLKKPRAIMFAEAPCVEVIRRNKSATGSESTSKAKASELEIIKPYA